ncbi:integrase [Mesorhizobium sp. M4B.F.Ca.ET.190.01.1.1]|nr:integrase [Mesorhizobium sp. M4B.F.Ca.ET.200.01.1.1]TGS19921.1 integrase [Mesorhizobium sp. M4B.F.Ca.ET.190.01.1.1]TGT33179.1 integrase [Mesorhizobium sp. M4B.F.Ca.ET.172.01.1.1]
MTGKVRHLLNRDGRYFARLVIPKEVRPFLDGKTELRTPLGPDRRIALAKLPGAVADLQHKIGSAERKRSGGHVNPSNYRYPLSTPQMTALDYHGQIALDAEIRAHDHRYAAMSFDPAEGIPYREGFSGKLSDDELHALVGHRVERFRQRGNTAAKKGTPEWRQLAQALCVASYEALARQAERDEGDFTGQPTHPLLAKAPPLELKEPVSLKGLLDDYLKVLERGGHGRGARRNWTPPFDRLVKFLEHDDARRLTRAKLIEWRDILGETLSAKTVKDVYLAGVRAVLTWAADNGKIDENPFTGIKVKVPKAIRKREKGYTEAEALAILKLSRAYTPGPKEGPKMTAVKQWLPILCAFTGARVTEIAQLRKEDVRQEGKTAVIRITPDAGTVKTSDYRDVPLHQQIIDQGFLDFVKAAKAGPLFHDLPTKPYEGARRNANRLSAWLAEKEVIPEGVQPNHAWRHRFKTLGRQAGIDPRVLDAIQGHAGRTASDDYGDVTITTMMAAIGKLPAYKL